MNDFDQYQPQMWLQNGLIVSAPVKPARHSTVERRNGFWKLLLSTGAMTLGSAIAMAGELPNQISASSSLIIPRVQDISRFEERPDVPTGYWPALDREFRQAVVIKCANDDFDALI